MAEGVWDGKMVPRSGSESSLSGTAVESALDLEAVGEDAKICNGHMITLVHIFSQPGFNTISILCKKFDPVISALISSKIRRRAVTDLIFWYFDETDFRLWPTRVDF